MRSTPSPKSPLPPSGFTMIELLVVILIAGVLAAIAAPGWLGFLENQRLRAANEDAFGAIRLAQSNAIRQRRDYQVSFRMSSDNIAQVAIHPTTATSNANALTAATSATAWESLGEGVKLHNTTGDNTATSLNTGNSSSIAYYWIAFDYNGNYIDTDGNTSEAGDIDDSDTAVDGDPRQFARVTFASSTSNSNNRRCVTLQTLLGGIDLGSDNNPTTNTEKDCQDS